MRISLLAPLALVVLGPSLPAPVGACSQSDIDGGTHSLDPAFSADTTPPSPVTVTYEILPHSPADSGCGGTKCGRLPLVLLRLSASDVGTPSERVGYKFTVVDGQPPQGLHVSSVLLAANGEVGLPFDTDAGSFSFDLEVRAVDLNGNEGPPVVIAIED